MKQDIKQWRLEVLLRENIELDDMMRKVEVIENMAEQFPVTAAELSTRAELRAK